MPENLLDKLNADYAWMLGEIAQAEGHLRQLRWKLEYIRTLINQGDTGPGYVADPPPRDRYESRPRSDPNSEPAPLNPHVIGGGARIAQPKD